VQKCVPDNYFCPVRKIFRTAFCCLFSLCLLGSVQASVRSVLPDTLLHADLHNLEVLAQINNLPVPKKDVPFEQSRHNTEKALNNAAQAGDNLKVLTMTNLLGLLSLHLEDYDQALEHFNAAETAAKNNSNQRAAAQAQAEIGFCQALAGKYPLAANSYRGAIAIFNNLNDAKAQVIVYDLLGQGYSMAKDYPEAQKAYTMAASLLRGLGMEEDALSEEHKASGAVQHQLNPDRSLSSDSAALTIQDFEEQKKQLEEDRKARNLLMEQFHLSKEQADSIGSLYQKLNEDKIKQDLAMAASDRKMAEQRLFKYYFLGGLAFMLLVTIFLVWRFYYVRKSSARINAKNAALKLTVEQLEETTAKLKRSEKSKDDFLANMSHEIRTPMNAIVGMARLLLQTQPNSTQQQYLHDILTSADNLLVIINDILDVSKIQAGKLELEHIDFELKPIVEAVVTMFGFKAKEKNLELSYEMDPSVPEVIIGDPVRLSQILVNLVGNALKFTEKGFIKIQVHTAGHLDEKTIIVFEVIDSGIGIAEEHQKKIFNSFSQASSDTTRKYGGTGLGLTICKQLTEMHGGYISVKSKQGEGTTFTVQIPYPGGDPGRVRKKERAALPATDEVLLKGTRILLVEDNEFNKVVALETLKVLIREPHLVHAANGLLALEALQKEPFDLVLMDVQMPEMDGYEATRHIRESGTPYAKIPIIAMTANAIKTEVDKCFEAGMDDYLSKPFSPDDLLQKIRKAVGDKS